MTAMRRSNDLGVVESILKYGVHRRGYQPDISRVSRLNYAARVKYRLALRLIYTSRVLTTDIQPGELDSLA
jgi:hypothetical protein